MPGEVALAIGDRLCVLLTFELEIAVNRVMLRRVIAITVEPQAPPTEIPDWFALTFTPAGPGKESTESFLPWVDQARIKAAELMASIADREFAAFAARHASSQAMEAVRWQRWLRVKAEQLCGRFIAPTGDLFGAVDQGPEWHRQKDPMARLVSFATDPGVTVAQRREANGVIEAWQTAAANVSVPDQPRFRPIGMLMVASDARS